MASAGGVASFSTAGAGSAAFSSLGATTAGKEVAVDGAASLLGVGAARAVGSAFVPLIEETDGVEEEGVEVAEEAATGAVVAGAAGGWWCSVRC